MRLLFTALACLISFSLFGQGWEQTFGGESYDEGRSVQQTTDGGYIVTGSTYSFGAGGHDVYLIKTDGNGIEQWSHTFGGLFTDIGFSVQQTTDGGFVIAGLYGGYEQDETVVGSGVYLIKTDGNGDELWSSTFGGTSGYSVQQTTDGGFIITGFTNDEGHNVCLIKTDGNGNEQWSQNYVEFYVQTGYSVQQTTDGGYIITGSTYSLPEIESDVYLIKTDGSGIIQWTETFGGQVDPVNSEGEVGYSVQQTIDGGYIIAGKTNSFGAGDHDVYLIKTDSEGTLSSSFTIPTPAPRKLDKVVDALGREVNHTTNQILFHIYDDGSVEKKFIVE